MAWSKFNPHVPPEAVPEAANPSAGRRAMVLRWATWITWIFTALGFGFMAYWLTK